MLVNEFFDKWNNVGCDFDGFYGFQCMDLANQYNQDVVGAPRLTGNAVDVWTTYPTDSYTQISNTPENIPQLGDIVIWGQGVGQYGHIAVFSTGDVNGFTSFDQNWPINSVCHFQTHNYNFVLGWLHPNKDVTTNPPEPTPTPQVPPVVTPPETPSTSPTEPPTPIPSVPTVPPVSTPTPFTVLIQRFINFIKGLWTKKNS